MGFLQAGEGAERLHLPLPRPVAAVTGGRLPGERGALDARRIRRAFYEVLLAGGSSRPRAASVVLGGRASLWETRRGRGRGTHAAV